METKIEVVTKVLIVDDNMKNIQVLGKILRNNKYKVEFATSGPGAIDWIQKDCFDLILLDIMMPEMSGIETCQHIRKIASCKDMPIIFLTAKTSKEDIVEGLKAGAQDYITKPFDSEELLARISSHIELKKSKEQVMMMNNYLEDKIQERTKELMFANQKLDKANKDLIDLDEAKSEFLRIISHELRTPLNGIKGFIDLLKLEAESKSMEMYVEHLELSVDRLEQFSLAALKITDLKTHKYKLKKHEIPVQLMIEDLLSKLELQSRAKNLEIEVDDKNCSFIYADRELLQTCCFSLIENAIKYSPEKSKIYIRSYTANSSAMLSIIDCGRGFSQDLMNNYTKLFHPSQKHMDQNTGLDLALVNLIMDAHGGKIEIKNNEFGGGSVDLTFPLSQETVTSGFENISNIL